MNPSGGEPLEAKRTTLDVDQIRVVFRSWTEVWEDFGGFDGILAAKKNLGFCQFVDKEQTIVRSK